MSPYRARDEMAPALLPPRSHAPPPFLFADFIHLLEARRVLIVRIALATILFALGVTLLLPTTYASSTVVMLDPRKNSITDLSAVLTPQLSDPAAVQNQVLEHRTSSAVDRAPERAPVGDDVQPAQAAHRQRRFPRDRRSESEHVVPLRTVCQGRGEVSGTEYIGPSSTGPGCCVRRIGGSDLAERAGTACVRTGFSAPRR